MESSYVANADLDRINARLIERYGQVDLSGIESASRSIPTKLYSPDAKRLFVRYFHLLQQNMQYISVFGRLYLDDDAVVPAEERITRLIQAATDQVHKIILEAEQTFRKNGVTTLGSFHIVPIEANVLVFSSFARRYLELITKVDHLMLMLETMAIDEFVTITAKQQLKSPHKRAIRAIARESLSLRIRYFKLISAARAAQASESRGRVRARQRDQLAAPGAGETLTERGEVDGADATGAAERAAVATMPSHATDAGPGPQAAPPERPSRAPRRRARSADEPPAGVGPAAGDQADQVPPTPASAAPTSLGPDEEGQQAEAECQTEGSAQSTAEPSEAETASSESNET